MVLLALLSAGLSPLAAQAASAGTASISGHTTGPGASGGDLAWTLALAYTRDGKQPARDYSDENGNYTITGLPAGEYTVRFASSSPGYAPELWDNGTNLSDATYFTLSSGEVLTGIDASLEISSTITGNLSDVDGNPLRGRMVVYSADEADDLSRRGSVTDAAGNYSVVGLPVGHFKVGFYTNSDSDVSGRNLIRSVDYVSAWYGGSYTFAGAAEVVISSPGEVVSGINAQLVSATFADVNDPTSPFYDSILWMASSGIATGTAQATGKPLYKPEAAVSRQAMAAFLYRLSGAQFTAPETPTFADIDASNAFYTAVEWMAAEGIATGTAQETGSPLFLGGNAVSRQSMALFLARYAHADVSVAPTAQSFADVPVDSAAASAIGWMASSAISTGTAQSSGLPLFKPSDPVSRQAMSLFVYRLAQQ